MKFFRIFFFLCAIIFTVEVSIFVLNSVLNFFKCFTYISNILIQAGLVEIVIDALTGCTNQIGKAGSGIVKTTAEALTSPPAAPPATAPTPPPAALAAPT